MADEFLRQLGESRESTVRLGCCPIGQCIDEAKIVERCAKIAEQMEEWTQTVEETDHNNIYTGNYKSVKRTTPKWRDGAAIAAAIRAGGR